jgi:phage repressor protein C with HTH and peptisase S24 domain
MLNMIPFRLLNMSETIGSRIRQKREEAGLSQERLAVIVGRTKGAVSQWESDATRPKGDTLFKLADALNCSARWLQDGGEEPDAGGGTSVAPDSPRESDYAVIPQLSAKGQNGSAGYLNDHVEVTGGLAFKRAWLSKMRVKPEKLSVIYAEGASMEPYIIEGDVVLIDHACVEPVSGQVYAIRRPDGGVSIKRLIQQMSGEWILSSDNPNKARYRDEPVGADSVCQVPIIGRVVWRGGAMA